jgi:hypothetical protein
MSFAIQIANAISRAQFFELNRLAGQVWKAFADGQVTEDEAHALSLEIEAHRPKAMPAGTFKAPSAIPKPKKQRSSDRQASIERRRRLARQSPVPPEHVHEFTLSEHATMTILVGEIQKHGVCSRYMDAIAALAGTCRTVVRNTINKGRALGLLYRKERRRRGQKSLANLVRILRPSWQRWVQWVGRRKMGSTKDKDSKTGANPGANKSGDGFIGTRWWSAGA